MAESAFSEREVVKELKGMAERLKAVDREPEQELSQEQANYILGKYLPISRLGLMFSLYNWKPKSWKRCQMLFLTSSLRSKTNISWGNLGVLRQNSSSKKKC